MRKCLLNKEKDLHKLLDKIYNIIPNDDVNKAIYKSNKERYEYQKSTFELPSKYPCIIIYDVMKYNYSDWRKKHLYNKDFYFINSVQYVTLDEFNIDA